MVLRLTVTFMFEPAFLLLCFYPQSLSAFGQQKSGNNPSSIKLSPMVKFHRPRSFPLCWGYYSPYKEKLPERHCRMGIVRLPAYIQGQLRVQGDPMDRKNGTRINYDYSLSASIPSFKQIPSNHDDKKSIKINRDVQNFFPHIPIYFMSVFFCVYLENSIPCQKELYRFGPDSVRRPFELTHQLNPA